MCLPPHPQRHSQPLSLPRTRLVPLAGGAWADFSCTYWSAFILSSAGHFLGGRWEGLRIEVPVVCHSPILIYASSLSRVQWWMSDIPPLPAQRVVCSPETGKNQTLCSPTAFMVRWSTALLADGQLPQPLQLPTRLTEALLSHLPGQRPLTSSFYQHGGAEFWPPRGYPLYSTSFHPAYYCTF